MIDRTLDKATVIIRSVGERTEALCRQLILAQGVPEEAVVVIREAPFSAALRKSYEIGIERDRPWTFCVDADLLLRPGAVARMLEIAISQPSAVCEVQGYILDKFFGGPRLGGVHLYRTEHLSQALRCIPREGVNIRPEYHTLQAMQAAGSPWRTVRYLVGLHDFEQRYADIFRKCFVQAHKHSNFAELFLSVWRAQAAADADFQVALAGFARGIAHWGAVRIDVSDQLYREGLTALELTEKPDLPLETWYPERVEDMIRTWREPAIYWRYFPDRQQLGSGDGSVVGAGKRSGQVGLIPKSKGLGAPLRFVRRWLGGELERFGRWLKNAG